jgi:hypothetical protein
MGDDVTFFAWEGYFKPQYYLTAKSQKVEYQVENAVGCEDFAETVLGGCKLGG